MSRLIQILDSDNNAVIIRLSETITDVKGGTWEAVTPGRLKHNRGAFQTVHNTSADTRDLRVLCENDSGERFLALWLFDFWYSLWANYCNDSGTARLYSQGVRAMTTGGGSWSQIA